MVRRILLATLAAVLLYVGYGLYNVNDNWRRDAIVWAAASGNGPQIVSLLAEGASPSQVGWEEHLTPQGAASATGHVTIVRLLLDSCANVNERDDSRTTALTYAKRRNLKRIAAMLIAAGGHE